MGGLAAASELRDERHRDLRLLRRRSPEDAPPDMGTFFLLLALLPLLPGVLVAKVARLRSSTVVLSVVLTWVLAVAGEVLVTGALPLPGFSGYGIGLAVGPLLAIAIAGRRAPTTGSDQLPQAGTRHP
jgi:hypothetical protein